MRPSRYLVERRESGNWAAMVGFLLLLVAQVGQGQVPTFLFSFSGPAGQLPQSVLAQGRDGKLFGVTGAGGKYGHGTLFSITTSGSEVVLHNFSGADGSDPDGVVLATDGDLYGATSFGGSAGLGALFKITTAGKLTVLHEFMGPDGSYPGPPIQASDGNFYGTTSNVNGTEGTIYQLTASGTLTTFFNAGAGFVMQGSDGNLYETSNIAGVNDCGEILKLSLAGDVLYNHSFSCGTSSGSLSYRSPGPGQ